MKRFLLALALLFVAFPAVAQNAQNSAWIARSTTSMAAPSSTALAAIVAPNISYVRVMATTPAYLAFNVSGGTQPATALTGVLIPANSPEVFKVPQNAWIRVLSGGTGIISITDLSQ